MKKYNLINNITGWIVFLIAAITYILTIEPTASYWDCGEFIATAFRLQVGHPPGAPLFMIMARVFSLFAFGDVTKVAPMVNIMSALASAFTILFLFWTITHIARKLVTKENELSLSEQLAVMGAGIVGALAYTFSDTFWFSAVEGEVYASSSFFTAIAFWAILKWENVANEKHSNRWLILIAYFMGLSIGVHLLNLLTIPAIVFVYYFKKYTTTKKGIIFASLTSVALVAIVMYGIIPGVFVVASKFELLFVNSFGLPYNSGAVFYAFLLVGLVVYGLYYTYTKKRVLANTILLAFTVIIIGYSSYTMIVIRAFANPPIDENDPQNVFALLSYLNREQYGDRPLFYGQYYNAPIIDQEERFTYVMENGKYKSMALSNPEYKYDSRFMTLFPRMYSSQDNHEKAYKSWANIRGNPIKVPNNNGEDETIYKPTFLDNITFLFKYQIGHMYMRYFMWNFVGRQNDIQGHGNYIHGNWISGIDFIDSIRLGSQTGVPERLENNKARNKYYFLPLILGLLGLFFHYKSEVKSFWVVMLLFFFTGLAIVLYLNQTPYQPRERDYAYAGSFYAFTIWIGFGVLAIFESAKRIINHKTAAITVSIICLFAVPGILAEENWDDHDRSGRYTARDFAANYLNSCAPNAILFTYGDNDTFPLWYAQYVEGIRTDVRVVNLSLLSTDWYITQMKMRSFLSDPVPFSLTEDKYIQGKRDVVAVVDKLNRTVDLADVMRFVSSDDPAAQIRENLNFIPSRNLRLTVDTAKVIKNGTVRPEDISKIVPAIEWKISRNYFMKSDLMILDLLSNFKWDRPVYFATSVGEENFLGLEDYFQLEGFAYRFVPIKTPSKENRIGQINTTVLYDNVMNKFKWGRINEPDVYVDDQNIRTVKILDLREIFVRLSLELIKEGKKDSALTVLNKCNKILPHEQVPLEYFSIPFIETYYKIDQFQKGDSLVKILGNTSLHDLDHYFSLDKPFSNYLEYEKNVALYSIRDLIELTSTYNRKEINEKFTKELELMNNKYGNLTKE
jgi:hypothetical protein